jgi:predicted lipoprotein with Yx(FWY)xxD motif
MGLRTGRLRSRGAGATTRTTKAALMVSAGILAATTLAVGTLASSVPASAKGSAKALTIKTVSVPKLGTVLATNSGLTLYRFSVDPAGKATCTGVCAKLWPPLLLPKGVRHIKAPHGVKGLSLVRVKGGRLQVFFHHQALYTFVSDTKKGQAAGQGVENDWFAVLANGKSSALMPTSPTSPTSPTPPTSSTSPSTATTPTTKTPATSTPTSPTPSPTSTGTSPPPTTQPTSPPKPPPTTTTTSPPTTTTTAPSTGGTAF